MQEFSVERIISGISERDTKVLDFVYENYFPQIKNFILNNNGTREDAQDIYQDAMLVIFQKIRRNTLVLTCSFNTYLYSVCRLLWLKQLEKKRLNSRVNDEAIHFIHLNSDIMSTHYEMERYQIYLKHFKKLSFSCQKIMELFLAKIPLKEIANILGFKSEQYAKKRKFQCKEKLLQSIRKDPEYENYSKAKIINNTKHE